MVQCEDTIPHHHHLITHQRHFGKSVSQYALKVIR